MDDVRKFINHVLVDADMTITDLAEKVGTSKQNISNQLTRNDMRVSDLKKYVNAAGFDLDFVSSKKEK